MGGNAKGNEKRRGMRIRLRGKEKRAQELKEQPDAMPNTRRAQNLAASTYPKQKEGRREKMLHAGTVISSTGSERGGEGEGGK